MYRLIIKAAQAPLLQAGYSKTAAREKAERIAHYLDTNYKLVQQQYNTADRLRLAYLLAMDVIDASRQIV